MPPIPLRMVICTLLLCAVSASPCLRVPVSARQVGQKPTPYPEYIWLEAENMLGLAMNPRGEPVINSSWRNPAKAQAPGWGINGPGVSAEWTQGGESEWNSIAASADETRATVYQEIEVPRAGEYNLAVRYADWARKTETFTVRIIQEEKEVFRHEFGAKDIISPYDEVSLYWGWAFTWDKATANLTKGPARVLLEIEKASSARRHVDCLLITNDLSFIPRGRLKPDFAAMRYLQEWSTTRIPFAPLTSVLSTNAPSAWKRPRVAGRDFLMPWNIAKEFWTLYDKPPAERPLYPFHAEPIDQFVATYKDARDVPIFASKLIVPVIYINDLPEYLKEGSPVLRYLRETRSPFAVKINYGAAKFQPEEGPAAWKKLTEEFRDQFIGWISGESIGYVWEQSAEHLKIASPMSRRELLDAHRTFYTDALTRKWDSTFHTQSGAMWNKLIPAQSTSSTSFAHALTNWGVRLLGVETAAVQPMFAMRTAFTRGAARQFGGAFLYYHAPNFGDTATTFTKTQNFAGPDNFFHSRYGATMGPSLSWYRKSYYFYYMAGASAIYLEQGFDQFFKPGPGDHPFQLNPLGRITNEFLEFAERNPDRGVPYTPVAILLDPAHGWDMTDYPHWPFGVSQVNRSDRALRELFGAAYYPGLVVEGEPATGDRQAFVSSVFGDIFDVLVAEESQRHAIDNYQIVVAGGHLEWSKAWSETLREYIKRGGVVFVNAAQVKGLSSDLIGVKQLGRTAEADTADCTMKESRAQLSSQVFRYEKIELKGAETLIKAPSGDPLVTINRIGKGALVYCAVPDLLGLDERLVPLAAHLFAHLFPNASPVKVRGDVEYLINRTERGWVVTLINNNGVFKPQQGMATVDRNAAVNVAISLTDQPIASVSEWIAGKALESKNTEGKQHVELSIAPGEVAIVELKTK